MNERPELNKNLDGDTFRQFYYLKEELVDFCRENGLPVAGGKIEITERIATFLDTGKVLPASKSSGKTSSALSGDTVNTASGGNVCASTEKSFVKTELLTENSIIEGNFVCSEKHRAFFKEKIGKSFSFNVLFQNWLKANSGKTYGEAIEAYYQILEDKKKGKTVIDKQFEYNTYIRDFFEDNKGKSLNDAIICWKYKKSLPGHNKYEKADLSALK